MKKFASLLLAATLVVGTFAGCGSNDGTYSIGMGINTALSGKDASAEADGQAQVDSTVAAVVLDKDGKIVKCVIDVAQSKLGVTANGTVVDKDKAFKSKKELKEDYGMKKSSAIGKEWYEQAASLEQYFEGKTVEDVKAIVVKDNHLTDADILSSVSIKVPTYIAAVIEACENAQPAKIGKNDVLNLAIVTTGASSKDATNEAEGNAYINSVYAATTTDASGKVTACVLDETQSKVYFSTKGVINTNFAEVLTKRELKENYNMKGKSPIGKEWYEQGAAFAEYVVGKTASEILSIPMKDGKPSDADLLTSVTITISSYVEVIAKAASAK